MIIFIFHYQIERPMHTDDSVQIVQVDGQNRQRTQTILLVDEVREDDHGSYTCTAQNLQGSRSASTTVKVQSARTTTKPKKPWSPSEISETWKLFSMLLSYNILY